jgi:beta-glucanase (GH16 family)
MLLRFLIFGVSLAGISCHAQPFQPTAQPVLSPADTTWKLVWADEFNTPGAPDPKNWQFETGFARNHEDQWYQADNARCANGLLTIEARREQKPNPTYRATGGDWRTQRKTIDYTSSSLNTNGLHQWQYGRFEMRGRIDISPGMWPAFWTLGVAGEWPSNGEIDIMEYYRNDLLANVAWGTSQRYKAEWRTTKKPITSFNDPDWASKFHVWRMDWDETGIRLYVDDQLLNNVSLQETINQNGSGTNPFKQPHYILLNLALGGDNGGDPSKTTFPRRFDIDYVRVYQR